MQIMYIKKEGFVKYVTCTQYLQQIIMLYQNEGVNDASQAMSSMDGNCSGYWNEDSQNYNWSPNQIMLSRDCQFSETPVRNSVPDIWQNSSQLLDFEYLEKDKYQQQLFTPDNGDINAQAMTAPVSEQKTAFGNPLFGHSSPSSSARITDFSSSQFQLPQLQHEPVMNIDLLTPKPYQSNDAMNKNHHAHIKLVPSSNRNFKLIVKRKRKRTVFTTEQIAALEEFFSRKSYVTREERQILVNQLQVSDKSIKVWFQNRRLKGKREHDLSFMDSQTEDRSSPDIARLDYVESQINQKTDEFGYVTLDDAVMSDLVNVIDSFLAKSNEFDVPANDVQTERECSPIYEPISPASLSDCTNEDDKSHEWQPFEPKESLQKLFDLQNMFSMSSTT